jgi:hypothetical protein
VQHCLKEVGEWSTLWDVRMLGFLACIFNKDVMFYATSEINVRFPMLLGQSNFMVL